MSRFIISLQFLTIIPFSKNTNVNEEDLGKSMLYFPLAGLFIGVCLVGVNLGLSLLLPQSVVDGLIIAFLVVITGSMHLDALADTIDGIGSGKERKEKLRIMKDPTVGAMGVVAIILVLMLKYLALTAIPGTLKNQALLVMPVMGRWAQVIVSYFSSYAGLKRGLGGPFISHVSLFILVAASIMAVLIASFLFLVKGVVIALSVLVFSLMYSLFFKRLLGGVTGDVLGAGNEIIEAAVLIMILINF
ncbi:MAG: adenosylcobinamide-GDP ribazoletransferase [Deltaproteobacteria bacterium]|nr:adenosylcobinamide-GDP ribazoletransferase [Deltaproteobacteria bacterium]